MESLLQRELQISNSLTSKLKRRPEGILVNGKKAYTTLILQAGDVLTASVGDPYDPKAPGPVPMPLTVLFEDQDFLVLDKPGNIAVQPTREAGEATLENGLMAYLEAGEYPHPVSRLDRGTTGLVLFAKSGYAHELMKRRIHTPELQKEYLAVAQGSVPWDSGEINAPIGFTEGSTYKRCVRPDGAPSKTGYETLQRYEDKTLLKLIPYTGRTHQLRLHMAYIGFPLIGDWLYGSASESIDRPALHSHKLFFVHPLTGEKLTFFSPLPLDMECILQK